MANPKDERVSTRGKGANPKDERVSSDKKYCSLVQRSSDILHLVPHKKGITGYVPDPRYETYPIFCETLKPF